MDDVVFLREIVGCQFQVEGDSAGGGADFLGSAGQRIGDTSVAVLGAYGACAGGDDDERGRGGPL